MFILFQKYCKTYVILSPKAKQTLHLNYSRGNMHLKWLIAARKVHSLVGIYQRLILKIKSFLGFELECQNLWHNKLAEKVRRPLASWYQSLSQGDKGTCFNKSLPEQQPITLNLSLVCWSSLFAHKCHLELKPERTKKSRVTAWLKLHQKKKNKTNQMKK